MARGNPHNPPFATAKPYFRHDALAFRPASRPTWTETELRHTIETIWWGDAAVQAYYIGVRGNAALPGCDAHTATVFPQHPYLQVDANTAKITRLLPPQRIAAGNQIPAGLGPAVAGGPAVPGGPTAPAPPPRPINNDPFDVWSAQPWNAEVDDGSIFGAGDTRVHGEHLRTDPWKPNWINTRPLQCGVANEDNWDEARYLGSGSLWHRGNVVQKGEP
ncbi:hypothetical protein EK21DRAFT_115791 [Setomelanomma holmii]|uniref:Uncharacterized protein n=1 Tax=Setomelanomma holmii TaxID=210430 RepID=A0A9P4H1Z7_9PLEO|nr:hypothetical protein EK21DRAFT_115791 [Setomelanomma holmii]